MSSPLVEAIMLDEPDAQIEDTHRQQVHALDPEAVYLMVLTRWLEQSDNALHDYIRAVVQDGDTGPSAQWMPEPNAQRIGTELCRAIYLAIDDLAGMVAIGALP